MPRAAVLGNPITHSLSPALHRAAYASLGLTSWSYDAIECVAVALPEFLDRLGPEWAGLSLTMPLKRVVLEHVDSVSEVAAAVGAANTVLLRSHGRHADNTDVGGLGDALAGVDVSDPVVLGAGGTAAAAVAALRQMGASGATAVVRDPQRAAGLLAAAGRLGLPVRIAAWPEVPPEATVVISTVPPGAADLLATRAWRPATTFFDAVYDPWPTPLAVAAAATGCRVIGGLELLLHQAARQVRLMTGRAAPTAAMRAALPGN